MKRSNMNKTALKDFVYGGMIELMKNPAYYYNSGVNSSFNHWTDDGVAALSEFMNMIAAKMWESEQVELDFRAREMVVTGLKG